MELLINKNSLLRCQDSLTKQQISTMNILVRVYMKKMYMSKRLIYYVRVFFELQWIKCNENGHSERLKDHIIKVLVTFLIQSECYRRNGELKPSEIRAASVSKIAQLKS